MIRKVVSPLLFSSLLLCGCSRTHEPPAAARREPAAATSPLFASDAQASQARTTATLDSLDAHQLAEQRAQLIAWLLEQRIQRETMDQTEVRLAPWGKVQRTSVVPQYRTLESQSAYHKLSVDYSQAAHGWAFFSTQLQLVPVDGEEFLTLYGSVEALLREKLGKPAWSRQTEGDPIKTRGYRVGKTLELTLQELLLQNRSVVSLTLMEPQGEAY